MRIVSFASMISIALMAWALVSITGCNKKASQSVSALFSKIDFKAGQCVQENPPVNKESWENRVLYLYKIVEVGKEKYHTSEWNLRVEGTVGYGSWQDYGAPFSDFEFFSKKEYHVVNCPDGSGEQKPVKDVP